MLNAYFAFLKSVKRRNNVFVVLGLLFASFPSMGQDATPTPLPIQVAQKNSSGNSYQIGDRISLYVEIPKELVTQTISLEIDQPEKIKALGESGWYIDPQTNIISGNFKFIVSPIQTGSLTLPSLVLLGEGKKQIATTLPWTINVTAPAGAMDASKGIEYLPALDISLSPKIILLLIILLLALAVAVYFAYQYWKKKSSVKPPIAPPPSVVEHHSVIALKDIEKLYLKYPYAHSKLKFVAFGVSEILKNYFSNEFNIDASESTTSELLTLLRGTGISSEDLREVKDLFSDLDLVKFTKEENFLHFDESQYTQFRLKSEAIIRKWSPPQPKEAT